MKKKIQTNGPLETIELGRRFGSQLRGGEIVSLVGDLGGGKTHFIKGVVAGIAGDTGSSDSVSSPTFVMVNEYLEGRLDVFHIDAYRIESITEFEMLGFDDMCYPDSVVLIEWANRVSKALEDVDLICFDFHHTGQTMRDITISNLPEYIEL